MLILVVIMLASSFQRVTRWCRSLQRFVKPGWSSGSPSLSKSSAHKASSIADDMAIVPAAGRLRGRPMGKMLPTRRIRPLIIFSTLAT